MTSNRDTLLEATNARPTGQQPYLDKDLIMLSFIYFIFIKLSGSLIDLPFVEKFWIYMYMLLNRTFDFSDLSVIARTVLVNENDDLEEECFEFAGQGFICVKFDSLQVY